MLPLDFKHSENIIIKEEITESLFLFVDVRIKICGKIAPPGGRL